MAAASNVAIEMATAALPVHPRLVEVAGALGRNHLEWVLTGGDDHALAAAFPPDAPLPPGWQAIGIVPRGSGRHRGRPAVGRRGRLGPLPLTPTAGPSARPSRARAGSGGGGNVAPMPVALDEVMDGGWAASMAPVAPDIGRDGGLPARRDPRRPQLPAGGQQCPAGVPAPPRRRPGADRRPGPLSDAGPRRSACRSPSTGRSARCRARWATSTASWPRTSASPRPPTAISPAGPTRACCCSTGCSPSQPGTAGLAPEQGLGAGDGGGDPSAGRAPGRAGAAGRHPVGEGRAEPAPPARWRSGARVGSPVADVGGPRLLRIATRSAAPTSCWPSRAPQPVDWAL